ncbi:PIN domain-containing protein [Synechococcus sp. CS-1325]|uniref:PIN domain-containing protein n=1 Tax=Synechococcus sp. CS-1325 TaxID=2847979 RepID=UPI00223AB8A8|nr:PIN domain-containing protein [Synechococcus sp. CS-1325]MCT0198302.1 PIN domain-containing protein [Synechococcus sp. CS-1325]
MNRFTVVYDACVLYPAPLRDLLMQLALTDLYRARWSDQIHNEWITAVLRNRSDLTRQQLERTRSLMNAHVRDALVDGHQTLITALELPDPDDRHVLAAAIKCGADLILTFNLDDFPERALASYGICACHPDPFLVDQLNLDGGRVCTAMRLHRASLKNPPKTVEEYLATLEGQGLSRFSQAVRDCAAEL